MSISPADSNEGLPQSLQELIAAACERYKAEWLGQKRPTIDEFLVGLNPDQAGHVLRELTALEASLRIASGETRADDNGDGTGARPARPGAELPSTEFKSSGDDPRPHAGLAPGRAEGAGSGARDTPTPTPTPSSSGDAIPPLPERFGRYRVLEALGRGSFGYVYLAVDEDLGRRVAVKVPTARVRRSPSRVAMILEEARHAAGLRHPAIVAVHDVGFGDDGVPFVVLEYVQGTTLAEILHNDPPGARRMAEILARVAEALHSAHKAGLVHRDLKPSNIMIDAQGEPRVGDFGLAIAEDDQLGRMGEVAGTPPYMAPEQVRGETHRLDGRTDVWALGVILYEGMTGRLPFRARDRAEFFDEILHRDPRPPRQIDDSLPRELERICLKCLSRRMNDRYQTAADLAEDLKAWMTAAAVASTLSATPSPVAPLGPLSGQASGSSMNSDTFRPAIIPKGLRPFDRGDADFFLDLLPGPRGRDGLPDSIRFWKSRIESRDRDRAFAVGLLYGPSGCGKSSLVRAGLLERVEASVVRIYLEAVPGETESILREMLRRRFPKLPERADLPALLGLIRGGGILAPGEKLLIVLDQFEQWLHSHQSDPDSELVRALRQCDGEHVQALVLVRDDFWMAITQFFRTLEVRLAEGRNSAAVELFDTKHARRVLRAFGYSYGRIPEGTAGDDPELTQFLDRAVAELSGPNGRVIPVRLCLLAEMLRRRPWVPATLRDLGGFEGIGATFLEETFGPSAPPTHRLHAAAAQAVLKALLPEPGSDLKGKLRTVQSLRLASGYADRPADFDALLAILDNELRLVTPSDPEQVAFAASGGAARAEESYQLTHDYLVPSLRSWLTRRQRETRRGRAEIRLASMTALWRDRPERRHLPSLLEWLGILSNTRPRNWDDGERTMMRAAARHHLTRLGAGAAVACVLGVAAWWFERDRQSATLLGQAQRASYANLAPLIPELGARINLLRGRLERSLADPKASDREREIAAILLYRDHPTVRRAAQLRDRLGHAEADELAILCDALATHWGEAATGPIQTVVADESAAPAARLRMACALVRLDPSENLVVAAAPALAEAMLQEESRSLARWVELLGPCARSLAAPLGRICCDAGRDATTRATAAAVLAEVLGSPSGDPVELARWVVESLPDTSRILRRKLERLEVRAPALAYLRGVLAEVVPDAADEPRKDELARRQAGAAVALAALGDAANVWPRLRHHDDPRLRSLLIQRLAGAGLPPELLVDHLSLPDLDPIERQAVLLVCAETDRATIPAPLRGALTQSASRLLESDPHPAVHSAAELLLERWGDGELPAREARPIMMEAPEPGSLAWERGPEGHTFAILPAPLEFRMGSPEAERGRDVNKDRERLHYRRIDRTIAVATREVSLRQLQALDRKHAQDARHGNELDCPANCVDWFTAARYCNWLSKKANIPRREWCYPEPITPGAAIAAGAVELEGYRLPTEAEWEYLCRAQTLTSRPFGQSEELLPKYAWTYLNSGDLVKPVGTLLPNEFGLFDVLGNVWEWCHDGEVKVKGPRKFYPDYPDGNGAHPAPDPDLGFPKLESGTYRLLRGGAFDYSPMHARAANRYAVTAGLKDPYVGFRVVRTIRPRHK